MITDNTAKWNVRKITDFGSTYDFPVGFQHFTTNPNIPVGWLPLLGGTHSREAYPDLWAWIQEQGKYLITEAEWQEKASTNNGVAQFYSDGDGSTTFRVPNMSCWFRGASSRDEIGTYLEAGLPNITGTFPDGNFDDDSKRTGAFTLTEIGNSKVYGLSTSSYTTAGSFDASLSNSIYGNSDTVQPPSVVGVWLVKAFGTVSNVGNQDLADISSGLAVTEGRVSEVEGRVYLTESYSEGADWYRVWSNGWVEQGGQISITASAEHPKTFLKAFADIDYTIQYTLLSTRNDSLYARAGSVYSITTTGFSVYPQTANGNLGFWHACGKGA